jgi:hypothetical protein
MNAFVHCIPRIYIDSTYIQVAHTTVAWELSFLLPELPWPRAHYAESMRPQSGAEQPSI